MLIEFSLFISFHMFRRYMLQPKEGPLGGPSTTPDRKLPTRLVQGETISLVSTAVYENLIQPMDCAIVCNVLSERGSRGTSVRFTVVVDGVRMADCDVA